MSGGKRWASRRDANEAEIVHALRAQGVSVYRIESTRDPGVFDLLCEVEAGAEIREALASGWLALDDLQHVAAVDRGHISVAKNDISAALAYLRARPTSWVLLEVKDMSSGRGGSKGRLPAGDLAPGGKYEAVLDHCRPEVARKLRRDQADFLLRHRAPRYVVTSVEEALRACGFAPCSGLEPKEMT